VHAAHTADMRTRHQRVTLPLLETVGKGSLKRQRLGCRQSRGDMRSLNMTNDSLTARRHVHPLDSGLLLTLAAVLVERRHLLRLKAY
jgi:hypothetical protein